MTDIDTLVSALEAEDYVSDVSTEEVDEGVVVDVTLNMTRTAYQLDSESRESSYGLDLLEVMEQHGAPVPKGKPQYGVLFEDDGTPHVTNLVE